MPSSMREHDKPDTGTWRETALWFGVFVGFLSFIAIIDWVAAVHP